MERRTNNNMRTGREMVNAGLDQCAVGAVHVCADVACIAKAERGLSRAATGDKAACPPIHLVYAHKVSAELRHLTAPQGVVHTGGYCHSFGPAMSSADTVKLIKKPWPVAYLTYLPQTWFSFLALAGEAKTARALQIELLVEALGSHGGELTNLCEDSLVLSLNNMRRVKSVVMKHAIEAALLDCVSFLDSGLARGNIPRKQCAL